MAEHGVAIEVAPGIRRIIAPNPSPMTHWGTNTYMIGDHDVVVIDPGPEDAEHLAAILAAGSVSAILVTHAHRDHSLLAPRLSAETGARVMGFGPPEAGRSEIMARLAEAGDLGGGEGVDEGFSPHLSLAHGDKVTAFDIEVVHTPGHFPGHLSFALGEVLFSGDHVMEWSTTLISPPEGDIGAFMTSCDTLLARGETLYLPGHGAPVTDPRARITWLMHHRRDREAQILDALTQSPATANGLAEKIYTEIAPNLLPAASRNVLAHLIDLKERNIVAPQGEFTWDAAFHLV